MNFLRIGTLAFFVSFCLTKPTAAGPYSFINIVDTTTPAPAGIFDFIGAIYGISGDTVAFYGGYPGGHGLFTGNGGAWNAVVKTGDAAPSGTFTSLVGPTISGNSVAFSGLYNGTQSVFRTDGGTLTAIASHGDPTSEGPLVIQNSLPVVAIDGDTISFQALFDPPTFPTRPGHFIGSGGPLTRVVKLGDTTSLGAVTLPATQLPAIDDGVVAFRASFSPIQNTVDAIYVGSGGALTEIVREGRVAPFGTFSFVGGSGNFSNFSISNNVVAFNATYLDSNSVSKSGIFIGDGTSFGIIAMSDDPIVSEASSPFINSNPSISGDTVAFRASLASGAGIFVGDGGPLTTVIKTGDSLFGQTLTDILFRPYSLDPAGSGNIAFRYELADGRIGIAMAILVPEPRSNIITALGAVLLFAHFRRQGLVTEFHV